VCGCPAIHTINYNSEGESKRCADAESVRKHTERQKRKRSESDEVSHITLEYACNTHATIALCCLSVLHAIQWHGTGVCVFICMTLRIHMESFEAAVVRRCVCACAYKATAPTQRCPQAASK